MWGVCQCFSRITDASVTEVARKCTALEVLNLSGCKVGFICLSSMPDILRCTIHQMKWSFHWKPSSMNSFAA